MAEGTLHVQTLFPAYSGGTIGEVVVTLMRLVYYTHARRASYQAPEEATMQQEHPDAMYE